MVSWWSMTVFFFLWWLFMSLLKSSTYKKMKNKRYFSKIRKMCTSSSKSFHPRLLMHRVSFWSISERFNLFLIVVFESLNCPQFEKVDLKIMQSLLERVQTCKRCRKTEESVVTWHTAKYGDLYSEFVLCLLPIQSAHTQQWTHTHCEHTPRSVGSHLFCVGAVGGSVTCSRVPQSWYWRWKRALYIHFPHLQFLPARDSNSQPLDCESTL